MAPTDSDGTDSPGDPPHDRDPRPGPRALRAMQDAVRRAREQAGPVFPDRPATGPSTPVTDPSAPVVRATLSPAPDPIALEATQMDLAAVGASGDAFGAGPPTANNGDLTVGPTTLRQAAEVPDDEESPTRMAPASSPPLVAPDPVEPGERSGVDSALRASVFVVGAIVVALVAWLLVVHLRGSSSPPATPAASHSGASTGAHHRRTHTTTPAPTDGRPGITKITPGRGAAGQVVTVTGVNLFSPDGRVQVFFGGSGAPTSCSSETACQATVPSTAHGKVKVTVVTQAGTSNAATFTAT